MLQMVWQGPRASHTLRLCWRHLSTRPIHCRPCVYVSYIHVCPLLLQLSFLCGCRCNVRWGMCSIKLKLFRSALGVGKIMRDPAPHVAYGRKTLQMCGSKIIPAFDLKGFMLVLGNIIRPCQLRYLARLFLPLT